MANWLKITGVLIMIYVITAGLLVPLKTGILSVSNPYLKNGVSQNFIAQAYNSNFDKAQNIRAWLKINEDYAFKANATEAIGYDQVKLNFDIPSSFPVGDSLIYATLILDNELDGPSVLPEAVTFRNLKKVDSTAIFQNAPIKDINYDSSFKFPYRNILIETIRNTFFHVAIWMAMFFILTVSLIKSIRYLRTNNLDYDHSASAYAEVGIVFGMIGLATGSVWAKYAWGAFWTSDIKLNMSAVSMLIYTAYWILRGSIQSIDSKARISAIYNIFAYSLMIPLLLILPRMTDSLHPGNGGNPALGGEDLDNTLRMVFYPAIIGLSILGSWIAQLSAKLKKIEIDS